MSWPHCCSLGVLCTCAFLFEPTAKEPKAPTYAANRALGCWEVLDAGFSFLVAASHQHLNGEHNEASVLISVQTQLAFLGLAGSQQTTKALGA